MYKKKDSKIASGLTNSASNTFYKCLIDTTIFYAEQTMTVSLINIKFINYIHLSVIKERLKNFKDA